MAPALPSVATDLDLTLALTAAVISAYTIPFAAATVVGGQLVDRWGARRVLRPAAMMATLGLLVAALATGGTGLLAGRALHGAGAAVTVIASYSVARRRPGGLATAAAALTIGSAAGPLLGGLASEVVSWRMAVALPLPLLALAWVLPLPRRADAAAGSDPTGTAAVALGATMAATALQLASTSAVITAALLPVALIVLGVAGRRSLRGRGVVPAPTLLRNGRLRAMGMLGMITAATYFATIVIVPIGLGAAGWGPIGIGALLLPPAVSGAVSARWSDAIAARLGRATEPVVAALILISVTLVVLASPIVGALSIVVLATAFGMVQPRLLAAFASSVRSGPATAIGMANLVFLLGGGIGAAAVGGLGPTAGGAALLVTAAAIGLHVLRRAVSVPVRLDRQDGAVRAQDDLL